MIAWLPSEPRDLALLPMAARRALDRAGWKTSLADWERLPIEDRRRLAELGSAPTVDAAAVRAVAGPGTPIEPIPEPAPDAPPPSVTAALPTLTPLEWTQLGVVPRHALEMYARRGKLDRLRAVYDALGQTP